MVCSFALGCARDRRSAAAPSQAANPGQDEETTAARCPRIAHGTARRDRRRQGSVGPAYRQLSDAIRGGRLAADEQLPPSRLLAEQLGISRKTVSEVYARLTFEKLLVGRVGSRHLRRRAQAARARGARAGAPAREPRGGRALARAGRCRCATRRRPALRATSSSAARRPSSCSRTPTGAAACCTRCARARAPARCTARPKASPSCARRSRATSASRAGCAARRRTSS